MTVTSIAGIREGLELAEGERLLWDRCGMLRWQVGLCPQPGALLRKNEAPPHPSPGNRDLITTEAAEPQRLISSEVLSAHVTSLEGGLWSHLCLDPIFQKGVMG